LILKLTSVLGTRSSHYKGPHLGRHGYWKVCTPSPKPDISQGVADNVSHRRSSRTLLFGPTNTTNRFPEDRSGSSVTANDEIRYLLPVRPSSTRNHAASTAGLPFPVHDYPAVASAMVSIPGRNCSHGYPLTITLFVIVGRWLPWRSSLRKPAPNP
jgi:hypothetical protein